MLISSCAQRTFARLDADFFADVVLEQLNRPSERRCPVAKASNEVVELLSEHWKIFAPGCELHSDTFVHSLLDLIGLPPRLYFVILSTVFLISRPCARPGRQILHPVRRACPLVTTHSDYFSP
jgi:hypothetical protein